MTGCHIASVVIVGLKDLTVQVCRMSVNTNSEEEYMRRMTRIFTAMIVLAACFAVAVQAGAATDLDLSVPSLSSVDAAGSSLQVPAPESAPAPQIKSEHKSVATAAVLSLVLPGLGSFYTGQPAKGVAALGASIAGLWLVSSAITNPETGCSGFSNPYSLYSVCTTTPAKGKLYGGLGLLSGAMIFDLISGIHRAEDINSGKVTKWQRLDRLRVSFPGKGVKVAYQFKF
jgi:hypothetical protein